MQGCEMKKKEFAVFGLGRFGKSVALALADGGCEVLVVDENEEKIHDIADEVTYAVRADVTDAEALEGLGIRHFDGAIIAIGENLEASVLAAILVKELGVPYVLAKVQTEIQAKILKKIGVDMVIFPEKETGIRIANKLLYGNFFDAVELASNYSMMEIDVHANWVGKNLVELELRKAYGINVIGLKRGEAFLINPHPNDALQPEDILVVIGKNEVLSKLSSH